MDADDGDAALAVPGLQMMFFFCKDACKERVCKDPLAENDLEMPGHKFLSLLL